MELSLILAWLPKHFVFMFQEERLNTVWIKLVMLFFFLIVFGALLDIFHDLRRGLVQLTMVLTRQSEAMLVENLPAWGDKLLGRKTLPAFQEGWDAFTWSALRRTAMYLVGLKGSRRDLPLLGWINRDCVYSQLKPWWALIDHSLLLNRFIPLLALALRGFKDTVWHKLLRYFCW